MAKHKEESADKKRNEPVTISEEKDNGGLSRPDAALKSDSKTSLGGESSSSTLISESEDSPPILSEDSQVSVVAEPRREEAMVSSKPMVVQVAARGEVNDDESKKEATSQTKTKKGITLRTGSSSASNGKKEKSLPFKNSLPPLTTKVPKGEKSKEPNLKPSSDSASQKEVVSEKETDGEATQQELGDSSSELVDVTDSDMSLMSGLNMGDTEKDRKGGQKAQSNNVERESGGAGGVGGAGDAGEGGDDSLSVSVSELSGEEVEEDLEAESEEDTMFEETPHQSGMQSLVHTYRNLHLYINMYGNALHVHAYACTCTCMYICA